MQLHTLVSLFIALLICGLAIGRGDKVTRWAGLACLFGWIGSLVIYRRDPSHADYGILAIDTLTLVVFVWISLRSRRIWTAIAAAFMAIIVASHVAIIIDLRVTFGTLLLGMAIWSYGVLACIAFGTWAAWRGRSRVSA